MFQDCTPSFTRYLRTWPRLTAFKRPERRAVKSFLMDDVLKRSREEPTKRAYIWSAPIPSPFSLYQANIDKLDTDATQSTTKMKKATTVVRPIPTYFCAVLPHSRRLRRTRTVFTPAQLREMEGRFEKQKYLSITSRNAFAEQLKLTPWQVKVWFQNRRMKWKKETLRKDPNAVTTRPKKGRPKKNEY